MAEIPFERKLSATDFERGRESVAPFSAALAAALREAGTEARLFAWVSDIHLHARRPYEEGVSFYGRHTDSSANLRLAIGEIKALAPAPDLLVLGGDLADSGCSGEAPGDEYGDLKTIMDEEWPAAIPSLAMLGNHDHADKPLSPQWHAAFEAASQRNWVRPVERDDFYYETRMLGWRFIVLDSRQDHPLSESQRNWLRERLGEADGMPTLVCVHRPFVNCGNWVDNHRLRDRKAFNLIDACPSVKAIFSGHTHKAAGWRYRRKAHVIFPALAYGIAHSCSWGAAVVNPNGVQSVFIKEIAGTTFDHVPQEIKARPGGFYRLGLNLFEASEMCDPCMMPRRNEPKEWD